MAGRTPMLIHMIHGSDANKVTKPAAFALTLDCTGGYFIVSFNGVDSAHIAATVSTPTTATLKSALEAMASIGVGNVDVTGTPGSEYLVAFKGTLLDTPIVPTADAGGLTGGASTVVFSQGTSDLDLFDQTNGMTFPPTGHETILFYNPTGGSTITLTEPSSVDAQNRLNDGLINAVPITSPGWYAIPKEKSQGWAQKSDGLAHLDTSASGLLYWLARDPID